jgi:uncharacterized protein (DUF1800 family)
MFFALLILPIYWTSKKFMDKNLTRREFLSPAVTRIAASKTKDPGGDRKYLPEDPFFKKYANKEMPFAGTRTSTGIALYSGEWTDTQVLHLLRRTTFGSSKESFDELKSKGSMAAAVNFLLSNPQFPSDTPVNNYQTEYPDTRGCPYGDSWVNFAETDSPDSLLDFYRTELSFKPWWIGLMIHQPTHILEKMTLFWSNHFGTRTIEFNEPKPVWKHYDTIRNNALGNFRTMIKEVTIDPHMLKFLNGFLNSATAPDENYARELQELFTVGKGPNSLYTEEDVKQAAKILTGWRRNPNGNGTFGIYFDGGLHDTSDKTFSAFYNNTVITGRQGSDGQYETDDLLTMLLATDEAAKYICRCIYRWFVYYVIDDAEEQNVIGPLAKIFRDNNYDILPVLYALFSSEHFFDPLNIGCIIKSPIDLYIGLNREFVIPIPVDPLDMRYKHWTHFKVRCDEAGQKLADPVDVSGWPAYRQQPVFYEAWINSTTIQKRAQNLNYFAIAGNQLENYSRTFVKIDSISSAKKFDNPEDPNALVNNFIKYMLPFPLSAAQFTIMKSILLTTDQAPDYYWTTAWYAYIANPGDPILESTVRQRLDLLIDYITRLEEYQLY